MVPTRGSGPLHLAGGCPGATGEGAGTQRGTRGQGRARRCPISRSFPVLGGCLVDIGQGGACLFDVTGVGATKRRTSLPHPLTSARSLSPAHPPPSSRATFHAAHAEGARSGGRVRGCFRACATLRTSGAGSGPRRPLAPGLGGRWPGRRSSFELAQRPGGSVRALGTLLGRRRADELLGAPLSLPGAPPLAIRAMVRRDRANRSNGPRARPWR